VTNKDNFFLSGLHSINLSKHEPRQA